MNKSILLIVFLAFLTSSTIAFEFNFGENFIKVLKTLEIVKDKVVNEDKELLLDLNHIKTFIEYEIVNNIGNEVEKIDSLLKTICRKLDDIGVKYEKWEIEKRLRNMFLVERKNMK